MGSPVDALAALKALNLPATENTDWQGVVEEGPLLPWYTGPANYVWQFTESESLFGYYLFPIGANGVREASPLERLASAFMGDNALVRSVAVLSTKRIPALDRIVLPTCLPRTRVNWPLPRNGSLPTYTAIARAGKHFVVEQPEIVKAWPSHVIPGLTAKGPADETS